MSSTALSQPIGERGGGGYREQGFWREQLYHVVREGFIPLGVYTHNQLLEFDRQHRLVRDRERAAREATCPK